MHKLFQLIIKEFGRGQVSNYFNTHHKKNALISYITHPFNRGINLTHTNYTEAVEIAKVLNELGYNVDIVNYYFEGKLNYDKYSVIFGFGEPLINSFYCRNRKIFTIYYGTGMHVIHPVSYTHLRAHETRHDLVCRLLLE